MPAVIRRVIMFSEADDCDMEFTNLAVVELLAFGPESLVFPATAPEPAPTLFPLVDPGLVPVFALIFILYETLRLAVR